MMIILVGYLFDESTWICCLLDVMRSTTPYPTVLRSMLNMRFLDDYTDYWEGPDGDELPTEVLVAFDVPKYKLMFAAGNEGWCSLSSVTWWKKFDLHLTSS